MPPAGTSKADSELNAGIPMTTIGVEGAVAASRISNSAPTRLPQPDSDMRFAASTTPTITMTASNSCSSRFRSSRITASIPTPAGSQSRFTSTPRFVIDASSRANWPGRARSWRVTPHPAAESVPAMRMRSGSRPLACARGTSRGRGMPRYAFFAAKYRSRISDCRAPRSLESIAITPARFVVTTRRPSPPYYGDPSGELSTRVHPKKTRDEMKQPRTGAMALARSGVLSRRSRAPPARLSRAEVRQMALRSAIEGPNGVPRPRLRR